MNKRTINARVKRLGVEIQNKRGDGYSYFTSLSNGEQIGDSVPVCYLNHLTLDKWEAEAVCACHDYRKECAERDRPADALPAVSKTLKLSGNFKTIRLVDGECEVQNNSK